MDRVVLLVVALCVLTPFAVAHAPARPIQTCQDPARGRYHEYVPPADGMHIAGDDGNLSDCRFDPVVRDVAVFYGDEAPCDTLGGTPLLCEGVTAPADRPVLDYDGEYDFATGGAWLFVVTGDGAVGGVRACFGAPSVGHHAGDVFVLDEQGFGPRLLLTADYSPAGEEDVPDCGDNIVEPCEAATPEPSDAPEPLNVVVDTYMGVVYNQYSPQRLFCNERDRVLEAPADPSGPTRVAPPFGPGADGSYNVIVLPDPDRGLVPLSGHVWTEA